MIKRIRTLVVILSLAPGLKVQASYTPVANTPGTTIWEIGDTIQGLEAGNNVITQASLPLTIAAAGAYALAQDLALAAGAVLTIGADNVILDLKGHVITTSPGNNLTIAANNVTIRNGSIRATTSTSVGIDIPATQSNLLFENLEFIAPTGSTTNFGIFSAGLFPQSQVMVRNCDFTNFGNGVQFSGDNVTIDQCTFTDCNTAGIVFISGSDAFNVSNCLIRFGGDGIAAANITHLVIDNVTIENAGTTAVNSAVNLGATDFSIIRNVKVVGTGSQGGVTVVGVEGITIAGSNGTVLENCVVTNTTGDGIRFGPGAAINCVIRGCTVDQCDGIGVNIVAPSATNHIYNTLSTNNTGADFAGVPVILIATSDLAASTAPYWVNIGY